MRHMLYLILTTLSQGLAKTGVLYDMNIFSCVFVCVLRQAVCWALSPSLLFCVQYLDHFLKTMNQDLQKGL